MHGKGLKKILWKSSILLVTPSNETSILEKQG